MSGRSLGVVGRQPRNGYDELILGGRPLWQWAQDLLRAHPGVSDVVMADPEDLEGLRSLAAGATGRYLLLHDPRYALVESEVVDTVVAALESDPGVVAVVPVRPVTDTLKRLDARGAVLNTVDRARYVRVLAPIAVRREALSAASATLHVAAPRGVTASGWEPLVAHLAASGRVQTVEVTSGAFPIVDGPSLALAAAALGRDQGSS